MTKTLLLILILLLAFFIAFIPHIGYAYPLHADEWTHLTYAKTISQMGSITFTDPFTGLAISAPGIDNVWVGYHVLLAIVQKVTGIDWLVLFRFGPSAIFLLTVLCVYIFANKQGYGLEAAFFTCLIPTTGGLLGPAFLVPMALSLLFIPLSLYIAFYIKSWQSYLLLFLIVCFLWLVHPTTAIIVVIVLVPYILINIKDAFFHSAGITVALLLPVIIALSFLWKQLLPAMDHLLTPKSVFPPPWVELPALLWIYGILPLIFSFIGIMVMTRRGGKRNAGLLLGLGLLLTIMAIFLHIQYGLQTIYERGLTDMLLLVGIVAGAGLFYVRNFKLRDRFLADSKYSKIFNLRDVFCTLLIILVLLVAIPSRLSMTYYHMIDTEDYESFNWIKEHIDENYYRALIDPWKATAFTAITDKKVARRIWGFQEPVDDIIYRELNSGCQNTRFLQENGISFVYNKLKCNNIDLFKIRDNIYLINSNMTRPITTSNLLKNNSFEAVYGHPPAHWYQWTRNCTPDFIYPADGRNSGECAGIEISFLNPPSPRPEAWWGQKVDVCAGCTYIIEGWIKTDNVVGTDGARFIVNWSDSNGKWIGATGFMKYAQGTQGWTLYQGRIMAPPDAKTCTICCEIAGCTGKAWYDDISLIIE